jgi:hypothetical protein
MQDSAASGFFGEHERVVALRYTRRDNPAGTGKVFD